MKEKENQKLASSLSLAMDEDVLNCDEMSATEGGVMSEAGAIVDNALGNCSSNNCRAGNCASGCGSTAQMQERQM